MCSVYSEIYNNSESDNKGYKTLNKWCFIFAYFLCPNTFVNVCISVSSHWQQIWCAAGVNLTGGKTRDGGSVVGASVFYSSPPESEADPRKEVKDEVDRLNQELKVIANTVELSMFVDFVGLPLPTNLRPYELITNYWIVLHFNTTNQLPLKIQTIDDPQTVVPMNKNEPTKSQELRILYKQVITCLKVLFMLLI